MGGSFFQDDRLNTAGSRRLFLARLAACGSGLAVRPSFAGEAPEKGAGHSLLVQPDSLRSLDTRSKIELELEGKLQINEPDPKKSERVRSAEVRAKSTLDYFERVAYESGATPLAAARRYVEAGVENWLAGNAASFELREKCRDTRMLLHRDRWQQFCESENLESREVELLHSPINSAALELLLPTEPAKPDSVWRIKEEDARHLFNMEAVHQSTLEARIAKVEKGVATIRLHGSLAASANSVATRLEIEGNFQARVGRHGALVNWVGLVIKETREISQAEPGFSITAQVRLIREEQTARLTASDEALRALAAKDAPGRWLVRLRSDVGRYCMLADRNWFFYIDSPEEGILRMVENNMVVAQCNVSQLTELREGSQLSLEGLQADVKESVKEGFGQLLESSEQVTARGLRLLRVVAAGEMEEVPIQWIYCHLSNDAGRRVALVFTMGGNLTDRFAAADEQMTDSFELLPEPAATDSPTPAPKLTATQPDESKKSR